MLSVFILNSCVVATAVIIHYEFLYRISSFIPKMHLKHRLRILFGVFAALIAHAVEVFVFALAYYFMHHADNWGHLEGNFDGTLLDCTYLSFTIFTTLGFGDIQPIGDLSH